MLPIYRLIAGVMIIGAIIFASVFYLILRKTKDGSIKRIEYALLIMIGLGSIALSLYLHALWKPDAIIVNVDSISKRGVKPIHINPSLVDHITMIDFDVDFEALRGHLLYGVKKGRYYSQDFGEVYLYLRNLSAPYIYIRAQGITYFINLALETDTINLYDRILHVVEYNSRINYR